ncbi:hypothetical protein [Reyranella sp.]|uniref:hypothetical protein n=1 Tax=Reyranella sp. TaxID=1929291 RepID=UPI0025EC6E30|nr:hypothetical protein [Reyranella sp.]
MFNIKTSRDFYKKLLEDFADLQDNPTSARIAINCSITAYHMHEWIWGDWLKSDHGTWRILGIRDKVTFINWLDSSAPYFQLMQDICNGSKHFDRRTSQQTKVAGAFDSAAFDRSAFDTQRLEIEVQQDDLKAWIAAEIVIESVVQFWRDFLLKHSPFKDNMPTARVHFTDFKS